MAGRQAIKKDSTENLLFPKRQETGIRIPVTNWKKFI
jgi:hypothetical protein